MRTERPRIPLSIAGSDPCGGAGLQADLKVFLRFGLSGAAVATTATAQSFAGVSALQPLSGAQVQAQLDAVLADLKPAAIKVGLLPGADVVRAVARALGPLARRGIPIVIDPVLAASDGTRFLPKDAMGVFMRHLVPLATVLTPNVEEAEELSGMKAADDGEAVVQRLLQLGAKAVLLKGGQGEDDEAVDALGTREQMVMYSLPRLPRRQNVHGTGCALSAAICALLALGQPLEQAVGDAKSWVHKAIEGARTMGKGARMLDFLAE